MHRDATSWLTEGSAATNARTLRHAKAGLQSSIANLANTTIGAGMLAIPGAWSSTGLVGGILLLSGVSALMTFTMHLLAECVDVIGRPATLSEVVDASLGVGFRALVDFGCVCNMGGGCISYLIIIGDSLPEVKIGLFGASVLPLLNARRFWICLLLSVLAPLTFLRRLESLGSVSGVALLFVLGIVVMCVLFFVGVFDGCPGHARPCLGDIELVGSPAGGIPFAALGTVLFAFGPHYNVVAVANELSQPSRARMLTVFVASQLGSLTIYTTLTVSAYLTFGKGIPGDVLLAYPQASLVVSVARLMLVFVVALSYPVVAFPLSQALHSLLTIIARAVGIPSAPRIADADDGAFHSDPMVLCAVTLVLSSTLVTALFVTSLGKVVSMAGGIGASIGCLILPGAAYAILVPKPRFALKRLGALLTLAIGLVVPPMLVVQNIE